MTTTAECNPQYSSHTGGELGEKILSYQHLNSSFRQYLVYHTGIDAGFFAEYSAMLHAMLYCLQNGLQFRLYADDANYGYSLGWEDYFLPFCPMVHERFNHLFNLYRLPSWKDTLHAACSEHSLRLPKWKLKGESRHLAGYLMSLLTYGKGVRLSQHVCFDPRSHFHIPQLGIDGDYLHAFRTVSDITWRLNEHVRLESRSLIHRLQLPQEYAGCQIRGGDKATEVELLPPEHYVRLLRDYVPGMEVFVLTDDYRLFERLQALAPDIRWHTLCTPGEKGYVNKDFARSTAEEKRARMVRFLASIEVLKGASLFTGSVTPGPSLFISKMLYPRIRPADCRVEDFPDICILPVKGRFERAKQYLKSLG